MYDGSDDYETGWETREERERCPECGMDWSDIDRLPSEFPECGASTLPF